MKKTRKLTLSRETLRDLCEDQMERAGGGIKPPQQPDPMTDRTDCITWGFTCAYTYTAG